MNDILTIVEDRKETANTYNLHPICGNISSNLSLTVQQNNMLIEMKYHGIAPTYNKLWRGRERAIE
jgi:hypothetical protein